MFSHIGGGRSGISQTTMTRTEGFGYVKALRPLTTPGSDIPSYAIPSDARLWFVFRGSGGSDDPTESE